MDLKDKSNALFFKLRSWLKLQLLAILALFCTTVGHTAVVPIEEFAIDGLGASINSTSDNLNLSLDYKPDYISSWLDSLRESKQDCQQYVSLLSHLNPCTPSFWQSDLITDIENQNPFHSTTDTEHES